MRYASIKTNSVYDWGQNKLGRKAFKLEYNKAKADEGTLRGLDQPRASFNRVS